MPPRHHYADVGPLEPPHSIPSYLDEPGDPWVLVSISSLWQDDLPLAEAALGASRQPLRVLLTLARTSPRRDLNPCVKCRIEQPFPLRRAQARTLLISTPATASDEGLWGTADGADAWVATSPVWRLDEVLGVAEIVLRAEDPEQH